MAGFSSTFNIDFAQLNLGPYQEPPSFVVGANGHAINLTFENVPRDQTPTITQLNERIEQWRKKWEEMSRSMNEWQTKYYEERERAAVATNELAEARTNSEDRPRPPLPNETLQAMLQLMNQGRNYTERVNQIQVVRLLTGWGLAQASGFVDQNRPAAATEAPTT